ncbi:MAG: hypothetical protein ABI846_14475 [Rudaea sp.]
MPLRKPNDGETVWIEYPEGRHLQAVYEAAADAFRAGSEMIVAQSVANWSYEQHEDTDISDQPLADKGGLTRS